MKQSIGNFLLRRLQEVGVQHIFGVPGDYNLEFMQQLEDRGCPTWIGTCNELNGSYAADGYARMRGLAALAVTNGVGALSVMNGIAGAYSEHVPVICICGSLPLRSLERGEMMHHTLADGGRGNFYRAFSEITAAQAELSPENAVTEIDRLILTAWRRKLPVYIELPSDISYIEINTPDEPLQLTALSSSHDRVQACANAILARLSAAHSPAFLLDLARPRVAAWSKWAQAAALGAIFLASFLAVQWPFANFLVSPASANRFFGTKYFAYFASPNGFDVRHLFFPVERTAGEFWRVMAEAFVFSILSTRLGMAWGDWVRKIRR